MLKKVIAGLTNDFETEPNKITEEEVWKWLRKYGFEDIHSHKDGRTPMQFACYKGRLDLVMWLFKNSADIRQADSNGRTPMFWACFYGYLEVAQWLVDHGAAKDIQKADMLGTTPMYSACGRGRLDVVQWLVEKGVDIRQADNFGDTPMHLACSNGHLDVVQWLVLNGALNTLKETGAGAEEPSAGAADAATNDTGHVDSSLVKALLNRMKTYKREQFFTDLLAWAEKTLELYANYEGFQTVLRETLNTKARNGSPQLWKLNGHGGLYKQLVVGYLGVVRLSEQEYKNIDAFVDALEPLLEADEGGDGSAAAAAGGEEEMAGGGADAGSGEEEIAGGADAAGSAAGGGTPDRCCTIS